jgi:hypothetical protein
LRGFLHSLVAAAILAHALVGCAHHGEHACDHEAPSVSLASVSLASVHLASVSLASVHLSSGHLSSGAPIAHVHAACLAHAAQPETPPASHPPGRCDCHWLSSVTAGDHHRLLLDDSVGTRALVSPTGALASCQHVLGHRSEHLPGLSVGLRAHLALGVLLL